MSEGVNGSPLMDRFMRFCEAWGVEVDDMTEEHKIAMMQCYYLDVIASLLTEQGKRSIISPHLPGR